jgi:phosphatidylinositol N-acetylglucosaminyltransferase subunit Y
VSAPTGSAHQRPTRLGNPEMHFSTDQLIGSAFIAFGLTLFVCFFYVVVVSKLLLPHQNGFLAAIQNDW